MAEQGHGGECEKQQESAHGQGAGQGIKLAADPAYADSQHTFIAETHFLPFARHVREALGLDLTQRSAALRDVAWSVAVQHGPGNDGFDNALAPLGRPLPADDAVLINAIYDERERTDKHFRRSTPAVQAAVADRFRQERQLALSQALLPDTRLA